MLNQIKIILITLIIVLSLTACKAEVQNDTQTDTENNVMQNSDAPLPEKPKQVEWITDYQEALKQASESGKAVFVDFTGSDWCIWCKRLNAEVFTQPAFIKYADENLVMLKLDFPRSLPQSPQEKQQNETLLRQYGIEGFPTVVILDNEGKEIARTGYQQGGADNYVAYLKTIIK